MTAESSVSHLFPHFLCYEMLGIVFPWLSGVLIKTSELGWKAQWTLPSFVRTGFLPVLPAGPASGRQFQNPAKETLVWNFGAFVLHVPPNNFSSVEHPYFGSQTIYLRLPLCSSNHLMMVVPGWPPKSRWKAEKRPYCLSFPCSFALPGS